jgi:N-acetylglucosamine repressor
MTNTTLKYLMTPQSANKPSREFLNTRNRIFALNTIRNQGPVSCQDIVRLTKIRPATVISYIKSFIKEGFITELGPGKSTGGRKPVLLELNPKAAFAVGVHLGETKIIVVVTDLRGNIVTQVTTKSSTSKGKVFFIETILETIDKAIKKSDLSKNKIIGIGVGVPGLVDSENGISIFCAFHSWWRDIPFKKIIEKKIKIPVSIENDTRVMTLGEKWFGFGRDCDNFCYLDIGEGIAVGTFLNGELYRGLGGSAGELGHTVIAKNGPLCSCGNKGCLEALASTIAIENRMKELLRKKGLKSRPSFQKIVEMAKQGDKTANKVLREAGGYLGIATANIVNLLNPGLIIIGGIISQAGDDVIESLKTTFAEHALAKPANDVEIHLTELDRFGWARGAATLVLKKIFKEP